MEARLIRAALIAAAVLSLGASYRTQNFIVTTSTPQLAKEMGDLAETYRRKLAIEWLGRELPPWRQPCPITANVAPHLGAGGATSFMFDRRRPFGWRMTIQGSRQRVLDSVLPHEVTHTIFATHFGRPLPRWADEGACTTVEHQSERQKQQQMLITFLTTNRGIAFNRMFAMKEYPSDVLPLYSQGYSLARYLIAQGGKQKFVQYVGDGMDWNNWTAATKKHYGYASLSELQLTWLDWVRQGSPAIQPNTPETLLASAQQEVSPEGSDDSSPNDNRLVPVSTVSADAEAGTKEKASSGGWYSRQRDLAAKQRETSGEDTGSAPEDYSLSRPQPVGRPSQTVIEWSRSPKSSLAPARIGRVPNPQSPRSYYSTPSTHQGTILR